MPTSRHPFRYGPRDGLKSLYSSFVGAEPIDWDFSEGYPDHWEYWEAALCEECNCYVAPVHGEDVHWDLDDESDCDGWLYTDGPMMNYAYPIEVQRIGDPSDAALAIAHLPLCVVEIPAGTHLALTGGGMDLSWQICEAYMCLGYLPPTYFSRLPAMAGKPLNARNRWIIGGMRRSLLLQKYWLAQSLRDLRDLRKTMEGGTRE